MGFPEKIIERLSRYRRVLQKYRYLEEPHIYSSDLARILNLSPEQIRQDLMTIGFASGSKAKGYNVHELIECIGREIDPSDNTNIAFVGRSSLVEIVKGIIEEEPSRLCITAFFDFVEDKSLQGVPAYSMDRLAEIVRRDKIRLAVLAVPPEFAVEIADVLILGGVKGILNFTSVHLGNPPGVFIEEYDIISSLEKIVYFVNL